MCPKPNGSNTGLSKKSHVEDLDSVPGLFAALTADSDDIDEQWSTISFPVDFDTTLYGMNKDYKFYLRKWKL